VGCPRNGSGGIPHIVGRCRPQCDCVGTAFSLFKTAAFNRSGAPRWAPSCPACSNGAGEKSTTIAPARTERDRHKHSPHKAGFGARYPLGVSASQSRSRSASTWCVHSSAPLHTSISVRLALVESMTSPSYAIHVDSVVVRDDTSATHQMLHLCEPCRTWKARATVPCILDAFALHPCC
jgi:hypothetical protein